MDRGGGGWESENEGEYILGESGVLDPKEGMK